MSFFDIVKFQLTFFKIAQENIAVIMVRAVQQGHAFVMADLLVQRALLVIYNTMITPRVIVCIS